MSDLEVLLRGYDIHLYAVEKIGSICLFIVVSYKWAYTEKTVSDPISWLPQNNLTETAMRMNDKLQQRIANSFPNGNLCPDTKGQFWRCFGQDANTEISGMGFERNSSCACGGKWSENWS